MDDRKTKVFAPKKKKTPLPGKEKMKDAKPVLRETDFADIIGAYEELKESEQRFRKFVEGTDDLVTEVDSGGRLIFVNETSRKVFGLSPEECVGRKAFEFVHQDDRLRTEQSFLQWLKDKRSNVTFENRQVSRTGEIRDMHWTINLYYDNTGNVASIKSIARDITEQKKTERALRKSEERLRLAQKVANAGSWEWDIASGGLFWSEQIESIFGFKEGRFGATYEDFLDCVHSDDKQFVVDSVNGCFETDNDLAIEHRIVWPDGTVRWVLKTGKVFRNTDGIPVRMLGLIQDITARKQTERELADTSALLETIIYQSPVPMALLSMPDCIVRFYNSAARKINMVENEEDYTGKNFFEIDPPVSHFYSDGSPIPYEELPLARSLQLKETHNAEVIVERQDGSRRWELVNATPIFNTEGEPIAAFVVFPDITGLKQAEEDRRAQMRFLKSLEGIDRAIRSSGTVEKMLWNVIGKIQEIFQCDRAWLMDPCDPEAATFRVPVEVCRPEYPGAEKLNVEIPMKPGADQVCAAALATDGPVVYGPQAERQVYKELTEQFGVLSQMSLAVYPKVGKPWLFGMHQCSYPRVWTKEEQKLFNEIGRRMADALSTMLSYRNLKESEAELKKHRDHLEDLIRERTAELAEAKENAEAANAAKSDFLARMSHEIRTPLNAVTGLTNIVLKSDLTTEQRDYLSKVRLAGDNLLAVINDILDFSKVEAGQLDLIHAPFDLNMVLERLADLFSNRIEQKDLELIFEMVPLRYRHCIGDGGRLTQVLTNLIENAVKFTESGEIVVGMEPVEPVDPLTGESVLEFTVRDTGIGIAAEELVNLFEPFTQAEGYLTRKHEGAGLGLAICRRLVELMGGRIWAESLPGQGSRFSFTVTLQVQEKQDPGFYLPPDLRGLKVLVAEDNAKVRHTLGELLESFTCNVFTVDSGEKAVEMLEQCSSDDPFQLVLLDWRMGGLDGIGTARRIRASKAVCQGSKLPILIMVAARGRVLLQESVGEHTANRLLQKPVKGSDLFNTILNLFGFAEVAEERGETQLHSFRTRLRDRRVLVVEDSALNREVAVALFNEAGLTVETAENGEIAVEKVTRASGGYYSAVLMDIQMPVMDGYRATKEIRTFEKQRRTAGRNAARRTPVIALTAHALVGEKEKCLEAGMDDYLIKPIDEKQLELVLSHWVLPEKEEAVTAPRETASERIVEDPVLDVQTALRGLGGRVELYKNALKKFAPEYAGAHETIARHLKDEKQDAASRLAHTVKGSAAMIGAMELSRVAAELEKIIKHEENKEATQEVLRVFTSELDKAMEEIDGFLKNG